MPTSDRVRDRGIRQARHLKLTFGRELREARLAAGLSQEGVARASGMSQPRLSRLELAVDAPARVDELAVVCAVLGLRLSDVQALQRRSELKQRDSGVDVMILLVARSRHNAAVLRAHRAALESTFPAATHEIMSALRAGRVPSRNGIVVL